MGFLDFLFKKKEEKVEIVPVITGVDDEVEEKSDEAQAPASTPGDEKVCDYCGMSISKEQRSLKVDGKRYHNKPCFRELKKLAKKQLLG
jgi:hypothetical protein